MWAAVPDLCARVCVLFRCKNGSSGEMVGVCTQISVVQEMTRTVYYWKAEICYRDFCNSKYKTATHEYFVRVYVLMSISTHTILDKSQFGDKRFEHSSRQKKIFSLVKLLQLYYSVDGHSPLFLVLNRWPVSTGFCCLPVFIKVLKRNINTVFTKLSRCFPL